MFDEGGCVGRDVFVLVLEVGQEMCRISTVIVGTPNICLDMLILEQLQNTVKT